MPPHQNPAANTGSLGDGPHPNQSTSCFRATCSSLAPKTGVHLSSRLLYPMIPVWCWVRRWPSQAEQHRVSGLKGEELRMEFPPGGWGLPPWLSRGPGTCSCSLSRGGAQETGLGARGWPAAWAVLLGLGSPY